MMKQYEESTIKKNFIGRRISRRTAKIHLKAVVPGNDEDAKNKRTSIVDGWEADKKAVNKRQKKQAA